MSQAFVDLGDRVQINVKFLKPNTVLNCPTFDLDGKVVRNAYSPFTQESIDELLSTGRDRIFYTKPKIVDQMVYEKNLKEYLNNNVYQGPRTIKVETQKKAVSVMDDLMKKMKDNENLDFNESKVVINQIATELNESNEEIINLLDIQSFDDYAYSHALNVGLSAMAFARVLGMDEKIVKDIGLGGFLHDVGKIRLPYEIVHKRGALTPLELEIVKKHSRYGYEMIKESNQLSEMVKKIVLLHHERFDGTGYPFGFKDNQVEDSVYIVALAEVFDTLTSSLSYRDAYSSKESLKTIMRGSGTHFKPDLAHRFVNKMGMLFKESGFYQINSYVVLNTGEMAKIVSKDNEMTSRPGIEIVKNPQGKDLPKPISIDLNRDASRHIVKVVPPPTT